MSMSENPILWQPGLERRRRSYMYRFMTQQGFKQYADLHSWSVRHPGAFWEAFAYFADVRFSKRADAIAEGLDDMRHAKYFPGATLNYAEHLLADADDRPAIIAIDETGRRREISRVDLKRHVEAFATGLRRGGVARGDRVAGFLPNCPEAIVAMLATTSIGAVWSSCSPDFGANGVVDRFGQIEPRLFVTVDGYYYGGKTLDSLPVVAEIVARIPSIESTVVVPFLADGPISDMPPDAVSLGDFMQAPEPLEFEQVPFDHPLFVMFSSGTTGVPKCIVHGHGGTLIQHLKEHQLHTDLYDDDTLFYFTTCGWMMWNWLVSALASGARLLLYDGSPFADDGHVLWKAAETEQVSVFGTSAKYLSALEKAGIRPRKHYDMPELRAVLSTGSPLSPDSFDFVYDAISPDVQLSSIAGGTDILSCFVLGNPLLPVRRGEIQCAGLGMDVQIVDDEGRRIYGQQGELVCCTPFPSQPVGFWGDADGSRYTSAYFERFPGMWAHGDFAEETANGGFIITGRSDAVLNPGGVRIGTAEIYRQVDSLDEILESIVVGQDWADDVRVILFVVTRDGVVLDDELRQKIKTTIRSNTTPRHVPAKIIAVPEIPRTKSGKIVELAVRDVIHGRPVKNTEALANADALGHFKDLDELQDA